ncbi:MAG: hypothetical protein WC843_05025 [Candidatus Gracilibacteria bacterium]|jgi:hypothetical protein
MTHEFVPALPSDEDSGIVLRKPQFRGDTTHVFSPDGTEIIQAPQADPEVDKFLQTIAGLPDEAQAAAFAELQQANNPLSQKVQARMRGENEVSKKAAAEAMSKGSEARSDNMDVTRALIAGQCAAAAQFAQPSGNDTSAAIIKKSA